MTKVPITLLITILAPFPMIDAYYLYILFRSLLQDRERAGDGADGDLHRNVHLLPVMRGATSTTPLAHRRHRTASLLVRVTGRHCWPESLDSDTAGQSHWIVSLLVRVTG